ncbi:hypothetical protein V490_08123 [Pseudogymnoascus sp. VKM F-3557]|nr:hypothetical protein V490_08123 [Pseudogymnoascus sp. VKM F-3557]
MIPSTRTAFRRSNGRLAKVVESIPTIGATDALVRVKAVALNWKDAAMLNSKVSWPNTLRNGIFGSELAGEIVAIGERIGDRVIALHDQLALTGRELTFEGLGQQVEGTLTDYVSSMLAVAGLTAWNALDAYKSGVGKTVLLQGTGGVSIFALRLAQKLGFQTIITSSSDAKLERAKELGAESTINYKTHPQWEDEAMRLTGGFGVDLVVDQGGASTLLQSVSALGKGGRVSQVGLLTSESRGSFVPLIHMLIMKACCIQGIQVGTKSDLLAFCDFLESTKLDLGPIIDRVFDFDNTTQAIKYLTSGDIFGKVVIKIL